MKEQQLKALGHQGPVCYNNQCPRREQCLRWLANGYANEKPLVLSVVNIQNAEVNSGNCPLFAADKTVTVWRGMTRFSHDREEAHPGYYSVYLEDYGIRAEMTAGLRSGKLRFTKEASGPTGNGAEEMSVLLDLNHTLWWKCVWSNVRVENDSTITAYKLVKGWGPTRAVRLCPFCWRSSSGARIIFRR